MGTLHHIIQIHPKATDCGALIKIKEEKSSNFEQRYQDYLTLHYYDYHVFFQRPKAYFHIFGPNQDDQKIPTAEKGLFMLVSSGGKSGFGQPFVDFLSHFSSDLEDALFFVLWDNLVFEYKIEQGVLYYSQEKDDDYNFEAYFEKRYPEATDWLEAFYVERGFVLKRMHDHIIAVEGQINDWLIEEEYQEALDSVLKALVINSSNKAAIFLKKWLEKEISSMN